MTLIYSKQDKELLNQIFQIGDPASLSGLLTAPPASLAGFEVEYEYDLTPKDVPPYLRSNETKLTCIHCKKSRNHWKGLVFKHRDGRRMLIGQVCGRLHYGKDYDLIKLSFDQKIGRKMDLRTIEYAYPMLLKLSEALMATADHDSYAQLSEAQARFKTQMPVIFRNLTSAARGDRGFVIVRKRILDEAKMAERKRHNEWVRSELDAMTRSKKKHLESTNELPRLEDESKPLWVTVVSGSFKLLGPNFILEETKTHCDLIRGSARIAKGLYDGLQNRNSSSLQSGSMAREIAALVRFRRQAKNAMDQLASMFEFFDPAHLNQVATWASGYDGDGADYQPRPLGLIRKGGPNVVDIGLPVGFKLPDDSFIRDFGLEVMGSIKAAA